ncbi:hypothetical protein EDB85DRAFT_2137950 [Lactarius pseudohatsudake]|nr:hypothetical protein EDB85DRAFT_2137950 [Lactarius pseudohatsudake]
MTPHRRAQCRAYAAHPSRDVSTPISLTPSPCFHHQPAWALQRGPLQPAFTTKELCELTALDSTSMPLSLLGPPTLMTPSPGSTTTVSKLRVLAPDIHKTPLSVPLHNTKQMNDHGRQQREDDQDGSDDVNTIKTTAATRWQRQPRQRRQREDDHSSGNNDAKMIKTAATTVRRQPRRRRRRCEDDQDDHGGDDDNVKTITTAATTAKTIKTAAAM